MSLSNPTFRVALSAATVMLALLPWSEALAADPARKADDRKAAEWVLSKGGYVNVVTRDKETRINAGQPLPADAFQVVRIQIQNTEAPKNADPKDITGLFGPKLITAAELAVLAGLPKLEEIYINGVAAAPDFFDTLKTLPKLRSVRWYGDATLQDAHLKRFQELPPLDTVHLGGSRNLTIAGLTNLVAVQPALQVLDLKNGLYADDAIPLLLKLRKLRSVDVSYCRITPGGVASLAALPSLDTLVLSGDQCTAGLDWSKFPNISSVLLWFDEKVRIPESGLEKLATCRKLETLHLEGATDISLVQMRTLGAMKTLRKLTCYRFTVPDGSWANLASLGKLETLEVYGATPFDDRDLMALASCRSLKRVATTGTTLTDAGLAAFKKKRADVVVTK